jgi:hypothetical protein
VDEQGHARAPRARAADGPPERRALPRRRQGPISAAPRVESRRTPTSPTSTSRSTRGRSSDADVRAARRASTSSSKTRAPCNPIGLELKLEADLGRTAARASSTASTSTRTASSWSPTTRPARCPRSTGRCKSLSGVHIYALLCERHARQRPAACSSTTCRARGDHRHPTDQSITGVEAQHRRRWPPPSRRRAPRDDFRPHPGRLCDFCTFRPYCPAHGGDPIDAAELLGPGTVTRPPSPRFPLALPTTTPSALPGSA